MTLYVRGRYRRDGWGFSHELREASPSEVLAAARELQGVEEMAWCSVHAAQWDREYPDGRWCDWADMTPCVKVPVLVVPIPEEEQHDKG